MYNELNQVISKSGIWSGNRKETHAFLLSPSVYEITREKKEELVLLGRAIYDCLLGLSHMAVILSESDLPYRGAWSTLRKVFGAGIPKFYKELQGMNRKHIPRLLKVDFMIDQNGDLKIAEIDGHNKHGIGYSALCAGFRDAVNPEGEKLPGVIKMIAAEVQRLGYPGIKIFYADRERFYIPEFEFAKSEFEKHGLLCSVVSEMDADDKYLEKGLFLDLPFLNHRIELYDKIISSYKNGKIDFIIPPKPFLGAKGVLALLRNDMGDEHLESILLTFIKKKSLLLVRNYIPRTLFIGKEFGENISIKEILSSKNQVLKESVSSGMKGTVFSSDQDFKSVLIEASKSSTNWILQEEVVNQPQTFSWFKNGQVRPKLQTSPDWFMRVVVHYVSRQLADVIITARRDKAVHGSKDCIQLGTVVTN